MQAQNPPAAGTASDYVFQFAAAGLQKSGSNQILFAARASGLFRSRDGGQNWMSAYADLTTSERLPTTSVVVAPDFECERTVFAGLNGAILCSYDGGEKWQRGRLPSPPPAVSSMTVSPNHVEDGIIFAGTNEDGVLVSHDRGRNWAAWNFGLLDLNVLCLGISPDFATDETLFAGTESGLFRSTNGGRAWKELPLPIGFDAILSLALSSNFAQDGILFAGSENKGLLTSQDKGKSWQVLAGRLDAAPVNQILLAPSSQIFILHGGALLVSTDGGMTWKPWYVNKLMGCNITAILALDILAGNFLVGLEDERILPLAGSNT